MPKELAVRPHDQFRSPTEANPDFTYDLIGLANNDQFSDINVSISDPVPDGNLSNQTAQGFMRSPHRHNYPVSISLPCKMVLFTVSEKRQQDIIFDQNLSNIPATIDYINLDAFSVGIDGNLTGLPINYSIEDEDVAKILVTRQEQLSAYWKLDETLYSGAKDETGRYNGTLFNLTTSGNGNAWTAGYFGNAIELGVNEGRIDFGTVEIDSNFSVSFWVKPDDIDSNSTQIITKGGIPGMDVFRVAKSDENSSLEIYLSLDGTNETRILATSNGLIEKSGLDQPGFDLL